MKNISNTSDQIFVSRFHMSWIRLVLTREYESDNIFFDCLCNFKRILHCTILCSGQLLSTFFSSLEVIFGGFFLWFWCVYSLGFRYYIEKWTFFTVWCIYLRTVCICGVSLVGRFVGLGERLLPVNCLRKKKM